MADSIDPINSDVTKSSAQVDAVPSYQELDAKLQYLVARAQRDEKNDLRKWSRHHKVIFSIIVSFSVMLIWYGMWDIIGMIPLLKNPFIATIIGFVVLIGSGYFYVNMIGEDSVD